MTPKEEALAIISALKLVALGDGEPLLSDAWAKDFRQESFDIARSSVSEARTRLEKLSRHSNTAFLSLDVYNSAAKIVEAMP